MKLGISSIKTMFPKVCSVGCRILIGTTGQGDPRSTKTHFLSPYYVNVHCDFLRKKTWEPKTPLPAPALIRAYEHRTLGQVLRMVKDIRHLVRVKTRVRSARKARLTSQRSHS